jgi:hypothetical protein
MANGFKYKLESFLRKRRLDRDEARAEEITAHAALVSSRQKVEEVEKVIDATQQEIREQSVLGVELDPERQRLLSTYLMHQHDDLKKKQSDAEQAAKTHEETARNLETVFREVKTLEKHREGRRGQHSVESQRIEQKHSDEMWLNRARPRVDKAQK